jgi:galactose mutarotase-like enzyme
VPGRAIGYARAPETGGYVMQSALRLITLTDAATLARVQIAPERGAIVTSFVVGDRELLYMDQSTLADRTKNVRGGIPILFPFPGKLTDDTWTREGRTGTMAQHGFARQLAWVADDEHAENQVSMSLVSSAATLQHYPWPFHATLTYSLKEARLRSTIRVRNVGETALPYALGFHPYFTVRDKHDVSIHSQATRAYNNVSKRVERFAGFDFSAPEVDVHLLNHNSNVAALSLGDGSYVAVRASNDFGVWVVWSLAGKEFVCLEPWTARGDALNTGDRLIKLAPGETHESWMEIAHAQVVPA